MEHGGEEPQDKWAYLDYYCGGGPGTHSNSPPPLASHFLELHHGPPTKEMVELMAKFKFKFAEEQDYRSYAIPTLVAEPGEPVYSPSSPGYSPGSPAYSPSSPCYDPAD